MNIAAATDTGIVREKNEDAFWYDSRLQAMAVADGIGGHQGGEIASLIAAQSFGMFCSMLLPLDLPTPSLSEVMPVIIPAIDRLVTAVGNRTAHLAGMGTTLVGAVYRDRELHLLHTGDSRAAFISLKGRRLSWLTSDDNFAEYLVRQGKLTPKEARRSTWRHRLTACIGGFGPYDQHLDGHYQHLPWPEDTLLLLCSDGLLAGVEDEEIAAACVVSEHENLAGACRRLLQLAIDRGGQDNCTALLADRR